MHGINQWAICRKTCQVGPAAAYVCHSYRSLEAVSKRVGAGESSREGGEGPSSGGPHNQQPNCLTLPLSGTNSSDTMPNKTAPPQQPPPASWPGELTPKGDLHPTKIRAVPPLVEPPLHKAGPVPGSGQGEGSHQSVRRWLGRSALAQRGKQHRRTDAPEAPRVTNSHSRRTTDPGASCEQDANILWQPSRV